MKKNAKVKIDDAELDERVQRSKAAVLAATYKLLTETGLGGVSVDEVVKRSGVAKTTIYRHWPSRSALLLDACANLRTQPPAPDTGSLKQDLEMLVTMVAERLKTAKWSTVLPSIIDAAERDLELAEIQARLHEQMRFPFREVIERSQERGELQRRADPSHIIAALLGPLFYRRWFSREPLDKPFVKDVVGRVIDSAKSAA